MTDAPTQTFKQRIPIVAKMVESAFNGDAASEQDHVSFILVAYRHKDGTNTASLASNIMESHELIELMLTIIAGHDEAGHG